MHRLPNCSTSRFVRQPSVCEDIKQSSFSLNIQLSLPHACSGHVTAISSGHVTATSSPPLNWQSKSLISVKVVSTMLSSSQYSHFIVRITENQSDSLVFQNLRTMNSFCLFFYLYLLVFANQKTFSVRSPGRFDVRSHGRVDAISHGRVDAISHGRFDAISHGRFDVRSHGRFDAISHGRFDAISHGRFNVSSHGRSHGRFLQYHNTQSLNMEHVRNLTLFGLLSPPAEQEETCHFCFETITKGQFMVLKLPCCRHLTHTGCFKTWASTSQKRFHRTLRLLQNCLPLRRHLFPLPTGIHRKPQLHSVLPYKSPRRMHQRPHSPALTPNLRAHATMWTLTECNRLWVGI